MWIICQDSDGDYYPERSFTPGIEGKWEEQFTFGPAWYGRDASILIVKADVNMDLKAILDRQDEECGGRNVFPPDIDVEILARTHVQIREPQQLKRYRGGTKMRVNPSKLSTKQHTRRSVMFTKKDRVSYVKSATNVICNLAFLLLSWTTITIAAEGTVSSGASSDLDKYRKPYAYALPPGRSPGNIVGIGIAGSNDHVYIWYMDGTVSSGTSWNLDKHRDPYAYSLPAGKSPGDIVGIGIAGSNDHVYVWYRAK